MTLPNYNYNAPHKVSDKDCNMKVMITLFCLAPKRCNYLLAPKELHSQKGKDDYEEEEEEKEADDGLHGVQQRYN